MSLMPWKTITDRAPGWFSTSCGSRVSALRPAAACSVHVGSLSSSSTRLPLMPAFATP
jgi:hypothetical protein